jgi:hypothetical protein
MESNGPHADRSRHFGLVVDDRSDVRDLARARWRRDAGRGFSEFSRPPASKSSEYRDVQYTKAPGVLRGMKLAHLDKSDDATQQLAKKGIA